MRCEGGVGVGGRLVKCVDGGVLERVSGVKM